MRQTSLVVVAAAAMALAACSDDDSNADPPASATSSASTVETAETAETPPGSSTATSGAGAQGDAVVAGEPFPESRCAANREAGTITYLSGFDFAASASIVEVIVAEQSGYFDELCLDVDLQPSSSTDNYPLVASGEAQFASGGSFSELVRQATANEADLVAVSVGGRNAIDSLILKPGTADSLGDLAGATIGVKFALPPSIAAMLATEDLVEGEDYDTVLLDGFDPLVHITLDGMVGFPGYKSNEPGQLERADVPFDLFDPTEFGVPGSFGVLFTSRDFVTEHPTAAEDFVRATMRGLADALADPEAATATALELIEANNNPNFLSPEGEAFRWQTEAEIIAAETPDGTGPGVPDVEALQAELDAYAAVGLFGDGEVPAAADFVAAAPIEAVYDGAEVISPG